MSQWGSGIGQHCTEGQRRGKEGDSLLVVVSLKGLAQAGRQAGRQRQGAGEGVGVGVGIGIALSGQEQQKLSGNKSESLATQGEEEVEEGGGV